jgi:hypothetical protein
MEMRCQVHNPADLYPREKAPYTSQIGGWVDLRAGLDIMERRIFSCPCWESNPDTLAIKSIAYLLY